MSGSDRTFCGSQVIPGGKAFEVDFAAWSEEGKAFRASECTDARWRCV